MSCLCLPVSHKTRRRWWERPNKKWWSHTVIVSMHRKNGIFLIGWTNEPRLHFRNFLMNKNRLYLFSFSVSDISQWHQSVVSFSEFVVDRMRCLFDDMQGIVSTRLRDRFHSLNTSMALDAWKSKFRVLILLLYLPTIIIMILIISESPLTESVRNECAMCTYLSSFYFHKEKYSLKIEIMMMAHHKKETRKYTRYCAIVPEYSVQSGKVSTPLMSASNFIIIIIIFRQMRIGGEWERAKYIIILWFLWLNSNSNINFLWFLPRSVLQNCYWLLGEKFTWAMRPWDILARCSKK